MPFSKHVKNKVFLKYMQPFNSIKSPVEKHAVVENCGKLHDRVEWVWGNVVNGTWELALLIQPLEFLGCVEDPLWSNITWVMKQTQGKICHLMNQRLVWRWREQSAAADIIQVKRRHIHPGWNLEMKKSQSWFFYATVKYFSSHLYSVL